MAFTPTIIQPAAPAPVTLPAHGADGATSLLAALVLTMFVAQKSKKELRKLKRKALLTLFKHKLAAGLDRLRSLFSKNTPANIDNRTLLYILLGLAVLILIFVEPIAAIILLLLGIFLVLFTK